MERSSVLLFDIRFSLERHALEGCSDDRVAFHRGAVERRHRGSAVGGLLHLHRSGPDDLGFERYEDLQHFGWLA